MKIKKSDIVVLLPAFNEEQVIGNVLSDIQKEGYENICVIDDGSSDRTYEIAQSHGVNVLRHPINRGAGAAMQTGIEYVKMTNGQYLLCMDSDGQHAPDDITALINKMYESKADIVIGNRFMSDANDIPETRKFYNSIANIFTNVLCKNNYSDTQSGFRLLNRKAIETLNLGSRGFGFCSEMIILGEQIGLKIEQVPIKVVYTKYSMNKGQNFLEGVRTAKDILWQKYFESS